MIEFILTNLDTYEATKCIKELNEDALYFVIGETENRIYKGSELMAVAPKNNN